MIERNHEVSALRAALAEGESRVAALEVERLLLRRTDPLTGAHTVAAFREAATRELERARRSGAPLALALNAAHGAQEGDRALQALAALLREGSRAHDVMGRTGPGELAMLLPEPSSPGRSRWPPAPSPPSRPPTCRISTPSPSPPRSPPRRTGSCWTRCSPRRASSTARAQAAGGAHAHGPQTAEEPARAHQDVVDALVQALTERDRYTGEHSESVVELSKVVAANLGLDASAIEQVSTAALLHDIGKVGIPDAILHSPGKIDEHEWVLMREHPIVGERIVRAIPGLGGVARIVRHEHERWDGGGYPDGLTTTQIPVAACIILACDTYHAMTSDRPYRARMPHAAALEELARCAGRSSTRGSPRRSSATCGAPGRPARPDPAHSVATDRPR